MSHYSRGFLFTHQMMTWGKLLLAPGYFSRPTEPGATKSKRLLHGFICSHRFFFHAQGIPFRSLLITVCKNPVYRSRLRLMRLLLRREGRSNGFTEMNAGFEWWCFQGWPETVRRQCFLLHIQSWISHLLQDANLMCPKQQVLEDLETALG